MWPRKLLPFPSIMEMLICSVFSHRPLKGYETDAKIYIYLLPQGHQKVFSHLHCVFQVTFLLQSPLVTPFTVSHLLQGKENSKYENWLFFFFLKGVPVLLFVFSGSRPAHNALSLHALK